jgi:hypothetical protein
MKDTTPTAPARMFYGAGQRMVEAGVDPAEVAQGAFAAAFQLGYQCAEPAEVRRQLAAALAELERDDSHD